MQAPKTDVGKHPPLDRLLLSSFMLLCISVEQEVMSAIQALEYANDVLNAVVSILDVEGVCVLRELNSTALVLASMLSSTRALCVLLPAAHDSNSCKISLVKSVIALLKALVQSQDCASTSAKAAAEQLEWASLGWYISQNVLAASEFGGLVNVCSEEFMGTQLPDMLEELVVDCCDVVADCGTTSKAAVSMNGPVSCTHAMH